MDVIYLPIQGQWSPNPNGLLKDTAGLCDSTGRIFGLMPYPEGFNHYTNHPGWTKKKEVLAHQRKEIIPEEGKGIRIFRNAVEYIRKSF